MSETGLTDQEAHALFLKYGPNELASGQKKSVLRMLVGAASEPMIGLLIACAFVYFVLGDVRETVLLSFCVFVVIAISLYQEFRSTRAIEALRDLSSPRALVIRNGEQKRIAGREVVVGDLLILNEGDRVPADAHLIKSTHLEVDESLLTGESQTVTKNIENSPKVFSSTLVTSGQGIARVTATGNKSEVGKIGKDLSDIRDTHTRLQSEMRNLVRWLASGGITFSVLVVLAYGWNRGEWLQGLLAGITAAMALLPEELPVIVSIFLAIGAWRLSRVKVLSRQVGAPENLGAITVLCVDKTGTLTLNQMAVRAVCDLNEAVFTTDPKRELKSQFEAIIFAASLASRVDPHDPMEKAIRSSSRVQLPTEFIREYPLSSELLAMTCVWRKESHTSSAVIAAKGAPEAIARLCRLQGEELVAYQSRLAELSHQGLRVLGVASADGYTVDQLPKSQMDFNFKCMGLLGLEDPVREEARPAIGVCREAGIQVIMMTGDHPGTALKVAAQLGMDTTKVMTGAEVQQLTPDQIKSKISGVQVFARMIPSHKLKIVRALQSLGEVVAMTGDGVNDAPSLRQADVGVAMGGRGTDVAREAADIVLLDDNFTSIVEGIRLGRRIFGNIKRAMAYVFAVHVPIAGLAILPVLLGLPLVLFPAHILFLELIIDPACTLIFESERSGTDPMTERPRSLKRSLFSLKEIMSHIFGGVFALIVLVGLFYWSLQSGGFNEDRARTLVFVAFVFCNLGLILVHRSRVFDGSNRLLLAMLATVLIILPTTVYWSFLRDIFRFDVITLSDWGMGLAVGVMVSLMARVANSAKVA